MLQDPFLNYLALALLIFVVVTLFYGIIAIHDIPAKIAQARHHPHEDAIHAAGWVSLFTLHVLWPFLWIWAMAYRPERGWGFSHKPGEQTGEPAPSEPASSTGNVSTGNVSAAEMAELEALKRRLAQVEARLGSGGS